jgi:dienelactone hydrolase
MDKPGVGESQGNCAQADFNSELQGWRAAFDSMSKYQFLDSNQVIVLGMSNGGGLFAVGHRWPARARLHCRE